MFLNKVISRLTKIKNYFTVVEIKLFNKEEIFSLLRKKILPAGKKYFLGRQKKFCRPAKLYAKIGTCNSL
ncbi:hypothetical protein HQ42_04775 [Porphyromonas gulae]|nr:hypothetical protein HQ42_04775 [Porphyromonas gulae]